MKTASGRARSVLGDRPGGRPGDLSVLRTRRSLFDVIEPAAIDLAVQGQRGPGGATLAALHRPAVSAFGAAGADVVLGGRAFGSGREGWIAAAEDRSLGVGLGVALLQSSRNPGRRTWVLQRPRALRSGSGLEAAVAAADLRAQGLLLAVVGDTDDAVWASGLLEALGWRVRQADNDDGWSLLSALDHLLAAPAAGPPKALVAGRQP